MSLHQSVTIPFVIIVGFLFFLIGISGNLLNLIIFKFIDIKNPSIFLLFVSSIFNIIYLFDGLLTRILSVGFQIDPTRDNLIWCKTRTYIGQSCSLISLTCVCYAWFDQLLIISKKEKYRRLSNLKITKIILLIIILYWFIYMIPFSILAEHVSTGNNTFVCNVYRNYYFNKYFSYFHQPILSSIIPILFILIISLFIHQNLNNLRINQQRLRFQKNLIKMIFFQTISIIIQTIPYGFVSMYLTLTSNVNKSLDRSAIESIILNISSIFYYFSQSFSFIIYFISSTIFRKQFQKILKCYSNENHHIQN